MPQNLGLWLGTPWARRTSPGALNRWQEVGQNSQPADAGSTVTVGALTATQIASAAADYPCILASSALYSARSAAGLRMWWSSAASFVTGSDQTSSSYPGYNAFDYQFNRFTSPASSAATWYWLIDLGASPQAFDSVAILGHNFGTIGGLTITLKVADDSAFSTNLRTAATWTPGSSNKRLISLALGGGTDTYSNVRYILLQISGTSGIPQIGELVLSSRRQLNQGVLLNYNPDGSQSISVDFDGRSGTKVRYVMNKGQQVLGGSVVTKAAADATPVTGWWSDCAQGTLPFLWIEKPNSAPSTAYWMFFPNGYLFDYPYMNATSRRLKFALAEQGAPYFSQES